MLHNTQMWRVFSPNVSVLTTVATYLQVKEVARCREVAKFAHNDIKNWRKNALKRKGVVECGICSSIRCIISLSYCSLCEEYVCERHLERCRFCEEIFCSKCVDFCCL